MNLKVRRLDLQGPALARAYADGDASATAYFLAGSAHRLESYRKTIERIRAESSPDRWRLLTEAFHPSDTAARRKLEEVARHKGVFVATGQQAGLFVSPLFTLYKALTAARLAEQIEQNLEVPALPLFSVASEDHDWAEVDHTHVVDVENRLVRLSVRAPEVAGPDAPSPPIERISVGEDIEAALGEFVQATPETEFKADILEPLRGAYMPGRPFAAAFQSMLAHLLRARPFLVVRTADPYVKRASRKLLWAEWERRLESNARLTRRTEELRVAGFEEQVPLKGETTNLFLDGPMGRDRLVWEGDTAVLRRAQTRLSGAELRERLTQSPECVSPGALFRPVTEARAFPVVAYVGGSSEVAYLAQSQVLFDLHGIPAPVVVPRASFLLIERKVERVLEKYGLAPRDLEGDTNAVISRVLQDLAPPDLQASLEELRRSVAAGLQRVEEAAVTFDPGAKSVMGSGKQAVYAGIGALESKLQGRVREKNETVQQQLEKAAVNLYPGGQPQERLLNPLPYLIRYGEGLLESIYAGIVTPLG
jgi:bacillithiol biosynthesis cysteine-adding enzyme BshC